MFIDIFVFIRLHVLLTIGYNIDRLFILRLVGVQKSITTLHEAYSGKKSSEQEVNRKIYTLATNFIIYSRNVTSFRSNLIEINVRKRGTW